MKNEIPPSSTNAPMAMARMLPPPRLPLVLVDVVVGTTVGVVAVGVVAGAAGSPGVNGFAVVVP